MNSQTKSLSRETIRSIVTDAESAPEALLNLYKEVLKPIDWDTIENILPWKIQINGTTGLCILNDMHSKFSKELGKDPWEVTSLILNKGFSSQHSDVNDWEVRIMDDCITLKK